jgi:hypothetical protein
MLQKISSHLNLNNKAKLFRSAFLYSKVTNFIQNLLSKKFPDIPIENLPKVQVKEELQKDSPVFLVTLVSKDPTFLAYLKTEVSFFQKEILEFLLKDNIFTDDQKPTIKVFFKKS